MRIRRVAAELGYRPRTVSRTLGQRRQGSIAILAPQALGTMFVNPNFSEFVAGALTTAETAGYSVHFVSPLHGPLALAVDRTNAAGVIAIGIRADGHEIDEIRRADVPVVTVDSSPSIDEPSVTVDDEAGARAAATHLLALGHREFLVLSLGPYPSSIGDPWSVRARRMAGYSSALGRRRHHPARRGRGVRTGERRGRQGRLPPRVVGRGATDGRPGDERRDGDRRAERGSRAWARTSRATCRSSASTTSSWRPTPIPHSRRSASRRGSRARRPSDCSWRVPSAGMASGASTGSWRPSW